MEHIGTRIREARRRQVIGPTELARMAGITYPALYLIETGKSTPRPATIRKLAQALNLDPYTLLTDDTTVTDH